MLLHSIFLALLLATAASGQPADLIPRSDPNAAPTAYVGGQWWDGERFAPRDTVWAEHGVFVPGPLAAVERVVDLDRRFVVPPFGDIHTHMLSAPWDGPRQAEQFQRDGVLYVQVLTDRHTWAEMFMDQLDGPDSIDVAYAHGGLTSDASHPTTVYEWQILGLIGRQLTDADRAAIDQSRQGENDAYWYLNTLADVEAKWDAFLAHEPDVVKVYLLDVAGEFPAVNPMTRRPAGRGLSPEVLRAVVERAHAAGLHVFAHVETAADVRLAVESGVDGLAHLPGYGFRSNDASPYRIDQATITAAGARGMMINATAPVAWGPDFSGRPARTLREGDLNRRNAQRLHAAGARLVIGADGWGLTSKAEADLMEERGYFDRPTLLDLWSRVTPQAVFPNRAIGQLAEGFEASLLALDCDPLADWSCTGQIAHREKQGGTIGTDDLSAMTRASGALEYVIRVDPGEQEVRVEGLWTGSRDDGIRWATGTDADSSGVERTWSTPEGTRFAYVIDLPATERENSLLPSLNSRRLRAWLWTLLRYPDTAGGPVTLSVEAPAGWRAATAFGDAAEAPVAAPTLDAALRSPVLAGDIRLIEVETDGSVSRLAVRAEHPVADSVFALGFRQLVETTDAYVGGRETPSVLFAGIDLLEGKPSRIPGNFAATPEASAFLVLQHGSGPESPGFWGTIAHEYLHGWTPVAFSQAEPEPTPVEGRLWPWFREGLTNYIGYQVAHQAGLLSDEQWTTRATRFLREYASVEPGSAVTGARAYSEGFVIGLALDAALVRVSAGESTFRDWFEGLLERHAGEDGVPITLDAMRDAARQLGDAGTADLFDRLVSTDPPVVRAALREAVVGSGLAISDTEDGPLVELGERVPMLDPLGQQAERRAVRARLQAAYDAAGVLEWPLIPAIPVGSAQLAEVASGPEADRRWRPYAYGAGSDIDVEVDGDALRVSGQTGGGFTGAGVALALGTPDETADLSAFDGIEIDVEVAEGPVVVQVTTSLLGFIDLPFVSIGETDGRVTRRLAWSDFRQGRPTPGWEQNASAVQVLVRGQGEKTTTFTLHDLRLYRDGDASAD
ncbi:MAG: hypothetical protein AAGK21_01675 [Bacteroidota bacterium]